MALRVALQILVLTHAVVVDPASGAVRRDHTVVVSGGRIAAVGPSASTPAPPGARVVDARGKYLIPGLWDMHVHTVVPGGRALLALTCSRTRPRRPSTRWTRSCAWAWIS